MRRLLVLAFAFAFGCDLLDKGGDAPVAKSGSEAAPGAAAPTKAWDPASGTPPPPAEPPAGSWIAFESKEGAFKAEFPAAPSTETEPVTVGTITLQMVTYAAELDEAYYALATSDFPAEIVDSKPPASLLDGARDGAVANIAGKLVEEKQIEVDGHAARRIVITGTTEGIDLRVDGVLFLVGRRLYQAIVVRPANRDAPEQVNRFLASIHPLT